VPHDVTQQFTEDDFGIVAFVIGGGVGAQVVGDGVARGSRRFGVVGVKRLSQGRCVHRSTVSTLSSAFEIAEGQFISRPRQQLTS